MVTYMTWSQLKFEKHEGKTLPQTIFSDPDWVFWAHDCRIFREPQDAEAEDVVYRARYIKIPKSDPENWRIEYEFSLDRKFVTFSVIEAKNAIYGLPYTKISTHLDFSLPRNMKNYDKLGGRFMVSKFKYYYFNGSKMTKEKCENFFYDSRNFIWPN